MAGQYDRFARAAVVSSAAIGAGIVAAFGTAAIAVTRFSSQALREFATFQVGYERAIALLPNATQQTSDQIVAILRQTSRTTGTELAQLTNSAYSIISSGATEIADFRAQLDTTAQIAVATGASLESVGRIVGGTANAFNIGARAAGEYLASIARVSVTDFSSLATSFPTLGAVGAQAGLSVAQTGAGFGQLTLGGTSSAEAATQFRSLIQQGQRFGSPLDEAIRTETGGSLLEAIAGGDDFIQILRDIRTSVSDTEFAQIAAGAGETGSIALRSLTSDEGFADYQRLLAEVSDSQGEVTRQFNAVSETLRFQIDRFQATAAVLRTQLGGNLAESLTPALEVFTERVGELTESGSFQDVLDDFSETAGDLATSLTRIDPRLESFSRSFTTGLGGVGGFIDGLTDGINEALIDVSNAFELSSQTFADGLAETSPAVAQLITSLGDDTARVISNIEPVFSTLAANIENFLLPSIRVTGEAFSQLVATFGRGLGILDTGAGLANPALLFGGAYLGSRVLRGVSSRIDPGGEGGFFRNNVLGGFQSPIGQRRRFGLDPLGEIRTGLRNEQRLNQSFTRLEEAQTLDRSILTEFGNDRRRRLATGQAHLFASPRLPIEDRLQSQISRRQIQITDNRNELLRNRTRFSEPVGTAGFLDRLNSQGGRDLTPEGRAQLARQTAEFYNPPTARARAVRGISTASRGLAVAGNILGYVGIGAAVGTIGIGLGARVIENITRTNQSEIRSALNPFIRDLNNELQTSIATSLDESGLQASTIENLIGGQFGNEVGQAFRAFSENSGSAFLEAIRENGGFGRAIASLGESDIGDYRNLVRSYSEIYLATFEEEISQSTIGETFSEAITREARTAIRELLNEINADRTLEEIERETEGSVFPGRLPSYLDTDAGRYVLGAAEESIANLNTEISESQAREAIQNRFNQAGRDLEFARSEPFSAYQQSQVLLYETRRQEARDELEEFRQGGFGSVLTSTDRGRAQSVLEDLNAFAAASAAGEDIQPFLRRFRIGSEGDLEREGIRFFERLDDNLAGDRIQSFAESEANRKALEENTDSTDANTDALTENAVLLRQSVNFRFQEIGFDAPAEQNLSVVP